MNDSISKKPNPVVKWAGGKKRLLKYIVPLLPKEYNCYYEPFFGGGALLFNLLPKKAVINDINSELVNLYTTIRDNPSEIKNELSKMENNEDFFYSVRAWDRDKEFYNKLSNEKKAARLIYLNKTCFNGLYRVNSAGFFNTPYGKVKNERYLNFTNIDSISNYFNNNKITILNTDFRNIFENVKEGDFVYFDPPYDSYAESDVFTNYSKNGFSKEDQIALFNLCESLTQKGVKIMVSNSNTEFIRSLFSKPNYHIYDINVNWSINPVVGKGKKKQEVIITNYE